MENYTLTILSLASATLALAVPSEINYQGRLTDANGDAVTGDVSMSLKMFDAATAGNEIYSEDIGSVTLDSKGVYSFEFGAAGQSVVSTSETIATTNGSNQVFNATLENLPVDGSVSVSDGTYTWSQANGSSSSTEFSASVTPSSGAVSAIYLNGAPTSSVDITASYNYADTTLSGALSSHNSHWLELSVDGAAQAPRERVLSVPFAQVAGSAVKIIPQNASVSINVLNTPSGVKRIPIISNTDSNNYQPHPQNFWSYRPYTAYLDLEGIPFTQLNRIRVFASELSESGEYYAKIIVSLRERSLSSGVEKDTYIEAEVDSDSAIELPPLVPTEPIDFSNYSYRLSLGLYSASGPGSFPSIDLITVEKVILDYETL